MGICEALIVPRVAGTTSENKYRGRRRAKTRNGVMLQMRRSGCRIFRMLGLRTTLTTDNMLSEKFSESLRRLTYLSGA